MPDPNHAAPHQGPVAGGAQHTLPQVHANGRPVAGSQGPDVRVEPAAYVTIGLFSSITGLTAKAVQRKIEKGIWLEGREFWRRDGRVLVDIKGYESWVRQARV